MNQKQRDLLCKMVSKEAGKIRSFIEKKFPLLGRHGNPSVSQYCVADIETEEAEALPPNLLREYQQLKKRHDRLNKEERDIKTEYYKWYKQLEAHCTKEETRKNEAVTKLNNAVDKATIDVQFAEDADQVRDVLSGLPSVDELLS